MPTHGPWASVQRLTPWTATAVTMGAGTLDISQLCLSLSISLSSTWAASSTFWWAILASQRASLMWVFPPPRPRLRLSDSPLCIFFGCNGGRPVYADSSLERTECPRLLLFSTWACKAVDQVTFSTGRHCGRGLWSLCGKSGIPQVSWEVGLPLGQALVGCTSSLIR